MGAALRQGGPLTPCSLALAASSNTSRPPSLASPRALAASRALRLGPHAFEPPFNSALLCFKLGDSQESFTLVGKALESYPDHADSKELLKQLKAKFT